LARQVEGAGPDTNIVEILEKRFSNYLADPSQGEERRKFSHDWAKFCNALGVNGPLETTAIPENRGSS
jgi:hypothetical protein